MEKHVIFGANGSIGSYLAEELETAGKEIVKVGRKALAEKNYQQADALNIEQVQNVVEGASHIYITVKENHLLQPSSNKGKVRHQLYRQLKHAMEDTSILIVRSPDFFGPRAANNSVLYVQFLENILKGENPNFIGSLGKTHSYAFVPDLARAIRLLALDNRAYQQVWHLPAFATNSITEIADEYNSQLGTQFSVRALPKTVHRIISWFNPMMKEMYETRYQFDEDYAYNWDKFKQHYPTFEQTNFKEAIQQTIEYFH